MVDQLNSQQLSNQQLKFAYWFATHKVLLKRILIAFLIALNAWFWGYGIYGVLKDWVIYTESDSRTKSLLTQNWVNFSGLHQAVTPQPLVASDIQIISSGDNTYDIVASVTNSNEDWLAESFDYQFDVSGAEAVVNKSFILPGEQKYVIDFEVESNLRPRNATLNIANVKWRRVDAHKISDTESYVRRLTNFVIENIEFSSAGAAGLAEKVPISRATFDVYNNTAYNYWQVGFYVVLYRGASIGGVNYVTASQLKSGKTRTLETRWFEPLPAVTKVEIVPEINIFDPTVFMEFEGDSGGR